MVRIRPEEGCLLTNVRFVGVEVPEATEVAVGVEVADEEVEAAVSIIKMCQLTMAKKGLGRTRFPSKCATIGLKRLSVNDDFPTRIRNSTM